MKKLPGFLKRRGIVFEEALVKRAMDILALLARSDILKDAYLAGGTAAALQLGYCFD